MELYIRLLLEAFEMEVSAFRGQPLHWPRNFVELQTQLGGHDLVAFTYAWTPENLLSHLRHSQTPLLAVKADWTQFYLFLPQANHQWEIFEQGRLLGTFSPTEALERFSPHGMLFYLVLPSSYAPTPFSGAPEKPWERLLRLFFAERRLITYIYLYAVISGGLSLLLPLLIQTIFTYVQTMVWVTGVTTLLLLVALTLGAALVIRLAQYILTEILQRRLFLHTTLGAAYRIPRWPFQEVLMKNLPALVNRYFEVFTLEKNLGKLLLDVPASFLTLGLSLILLAFYAPVFAFIMLIITGIVAFLVAQSFSQTLKYKKRVSDEKYIMASWLEEIARALLTFKLAGLPAYLSRRTQTAEENYLTARRKYFRSLLYQKAILYTYEGLLALSLLGGGAYLVVDKKLSLGQFVASELVLFLMLGAIQTLVANLDALYDALVGIDKLNQLFEVPEEKTSGARLIDKASGLRIEVAHLSVAGFKDYILRDISFTIAPGEKVCLTGFSGAGKTTLLYTLYGLNREFSGDVFINGISLRELDLVELRGVIGEALGLEQIIEGTVWDNLTMTASQASWEEVLSLCEVLDLRQEIEALPEGFYTKLSAQGVGLLRGFALHRILLVRALLARPKLLIVDDIISTVSPEAKFAVYQYLLSPDRPYTAIIVSMDPHIMRLCDKIIFLDGGRLIEVGAYEKVSKNPHFQRLYRQLP